MIVVADTSAILALVDADDRHHQSVRALYEQQSAEWRLPWAILPEVDYLLGAHVGRRAQDAFLRDLAKRAFVIEWADAADLERAEALHVKHKKLALGLVDGIVMATAERLRAAAIATLDLRHFGAVRLVGSPRVLPRDLDD